MFTTQEENLMRKYIEKYATSDPLPLDQILEPWKEAKSKYLLPLLGGQFYHSTEYQKFNNLLSKKTTELYANKWCRTDPKIDYKNNSLKESYTIADKTFPANTKPYKLFKYILCLNIKKLIFYFLNIFNI